MSYILAVDGGNSKTLAVVADQSGRVLGVGRAGGSNHQAPGGLKRAMDNVGLAARRAFEHPGIGAHMIAGAYFCLSGADFPEDFDQLRIGLEGLGLECRLGLDNDTAAALRSGTDCPDAVAVVWGSGTNAMGRSAEGRTIRLPGVGWISGDWGGGGDLEREAIWLVARAHDGRGQPTLLTDLVLSALQVPDVDAMIRKLYFNLQATYDASEQNGSPADAEEARVTTTHLTPLIFQAARAGDIVARDLVVRSGTEVATTAAALLRRLDLADRPADVVLGGSVFKAEGSLLLDTVRSRLAGVAPHARITVPDIEPVLGSLLCALDMLHMPVDGTVREAARSSYQAAIETATAEVRA